MAPTTSSPPSPSESPGGEGSVSPLAIGGAGEPTGRSPGEGGPAVASRLDILAVDEAGTAVEVDGLDGLERAAGNRSLRLWVHLRAPETATLDRVGRILGLHPLIVTNIAESNQRAKVERVEDDLHLVLFAIRYEGEVQSEEIDFVLGGRFLLTVEDGNWDPHHAQQLRIGAAAVLARGPDYLLYALADWIVDGYFPVMDRLTDEIDTLQDEVIEEPSAWTLRRLFVLKRELVELRRAVSPAREMFNQLTNRELGLIDERNVIYYRDIYDHLIRVTEELDSYREVVSGTLDVYLTAVNNNLSNIMKRLTGVTVILAGIGAIAGVFGASEAGSAFAGDAAPGFWIMAGLTALFAVAAVVVLRRIGWI
jgi:magnesium transporter